MRRTGKYSAVKVRSSKREDRSMKLAKLVILSVTCLLSACVEKAAPEGEKGDRLNILFVLTDDHSAPDLGIYGEPNLKTPVLDRLAREGTWFSRAYVGAPQCAPSRATLMTGRSVVDVRMTRFSAPLPRDIVTFPEILRDNGYFTGLIGRNFHLDGSPGQGEVADRVFEENQLRTFRDRVDVLDKAHGEGSNAVIQDRWVYEDFESFLDKVPQERPFFLQLGLSDPHRPWTASDFTPDAETLILPADMPDTPAVRADYAAYLGEIQRIDHFMGYIMEVLENRGLSQNTLVVFMGDNGAAVLRGKGTLYEAGINVPLIAWAPGLVPASGRVDALVSGEDIAPTFIEIAGGKPDSKMTGQSFLPALTGEDFEGHAHVFAERGAHGIGLPTNTTNFDMGRVVVGGRFKLIYNALWQFPYVPADANSSRMWRDLTERNNRGDLSPVHSEILFAKPRPIFQLYDLQEDPDEMNNLANDPDHAAVFETLRGELEGWMILNRDYLPLPWLPDWQKIYDSDLPDNLKSAPIAK